MDRDQLLEAMAVDLPLGRSGDVEVRQFEVSPEAEAFQRLRTLVTGDQRVCPAGTYTALYRSGVLWMSDTPDERMDSLICLCRVRSMGARTALVNGLGLGSILRGLVAVGVNKIDVVEVDQDVINLVGPTCMNWAAFHNVGLRIHHGDAYTHDVDGRTDTWWDIVWSDVWESASEANLAEMGRLFTRYLGRCAWHGQWARELILERDRTTYFCNECPKFGRSLHGCFHLGEMLCTW